MGEQAGYSKLETLKWSLIILLIGAGVVLNAIFVNIAIPLRLIAWVVLVLVVTFFAYHTKRGKEAWSFVQAAQVELKKVIWPTRKETLQTTLVIVVMVFVMAMLLWGIDSVLLWAVSLLTGKK